MQENNFFIKNSWLFTGHVSYYYNWYKYKSSLLIFITYIWYHSSFPFFISSTNFLNLPFSFWRSTSGASYSPTAPSSMRRTLSLSMIVWSLWAMVITVQSWNSSWMSDYIFCSVSTSMLAVASSKRIILFFLKIALQIHKSYLSPELKFAPFSEICWSRPLLYLPPSAAFSLPLFRISSRLAFLSISIISLSVRSPFGSILNLRVPVNSVASYGIIVIFSRTLLISILPIFRLSISIEPFSISTILVKARLMVLLPAPVLPTTPILWPA